MKKEREIRRYLEAKQEKQLRQYLASIGISSKGIDAAVRSIKFEEAKQDATAMVKDPQRCKDIMKFKPNQGKATLTKIGEVNSNFEGDGIPVYQEDIDMIKKSARLAKKIAELHKTKPQDQTEWKPISEMMDACFSDSGADIDFRGPEPVEDSPYGRNFMTDCRITEDEMHEAIMKSKKDMPGYISTKASDEKIRRAAAGFTEERQTCNKDVSCPGNYTYTSILGSMDSTHARKNSDYGDAAYKGYKKFGDYYFLVQLHNKLNRLEELTINNKKQQVNDESIDDTLLDMANYAVMYLESRHRND